jgi:hypothetical protein
MIEIHRSESNYCFSAQYIILHVVIHVWCDDPWVREIFSFTDTTQKKKKIIVKSFNKSQNMFSWNIAATQYRLYSVPVSRTSSVFNAFSQFWLVITAGKVTF